MLELLRERDTDDFMLIKGSKELLDQFSRHYGHPLGNEKGILRSDRTNEFVSMALVLAFALLFLVGLLASIWADEGVQRIWLGYEAYATLAMYVYRFRSGGLIGSTEAALAKELGKSKKVALVGDDGRGIVASVNHETVPSVKDGQEKMKEILETWK